MIGVIGFWAFIIYGFYYVIKEGELFSPITLVLICFICVAVYISKITLYEAKYIYIDKENRRVHIKTSYKGELEYSFDDIYMVEKNNIGARFEFKDGKKVELNKSIVVIETSTSPKRVRNLEKEDLPGVILMD